MYTKQDHITVKDPCPPWRVLYLIETKSWWCDTVNLYSTVPIIEGVIQNIGNPTLLEMNFIYWDYKDLCIPPAWFTKIFVIPPAGVTKIFVIPVDKS